MQWLEAMTILGLTCSETRDEASIRRAWKQSVRHFHPDKNHVCVHATQHTQRLNQAREILLKKLAQDEEQRSWEADIAKRRATLQAEQAAVDEQWARMKQLDENLSKYWAGVVNSIRETKEAAGKAESDRLKQAHQERVDYQNSFYQRMHDFKARTRKRARPEQS